MNICDIICICFYVIGGVCLIILTIYGLIESAKIKKQVLEEYKRVCENYSYDLKQRGLTTRYRMEVKGLKVKIWDIDIIEHLIKNGNSKVIVKYVDDEYVFSIEKEEK